MSRARNREVEGDGTAHASETGRYVYSPSGPLRFGVFVLVVLTGGLAAVSYVNRGKILAKLSESPVEVVVFYSIFGLILVAGWFAVVRVFLGYRRFGDSTLELRPPFGVPGGEMTGTIQTGMREIPARGFDLQLRCTRRDSRAGADSQLTPNDEGVWEVWERTTPVGPSQVAVTSDGVAVPVNFSIPADVPETDPASIEKIEWTLTATATLGGRAYLSRFDVPVRRAVVRQPEDGE